MLQVDFVPETKIKHMDMEEKVNFLLNEIRSRKIVVMDHSLRPDEELLLIQKAMESVDFKEFNGVKYKNFKEEQPRSRFKSARRKTFSVIAPPGDIEITSENGIISISVAVGT